jgi:hypothetical protein
MRKQTPAGNNIPSPKRLNASISLDSTESEPRPSLSTQFIKLAQEIANKVKQNTPPKAMREGKQNSQYNVQ